MNYSSWSTTFTTAGREKELFSSNTCSLLFLIHIPYFSLAIARTIVSIRHQRANTATSPPNTTPEQATAQPPATTLKYMNINTLNKLVNTLSNLI